MSATDAPTEIVAAKVDLATKAALVEIAAREDRSISSVIRQAVRERLERETEETQ